MDSKKDSYHFILMLSKQWFLIPNWSKLIGGLFGFFCFMLPTLAEQRVLELEVSLKRTSSRHSFNSENLQILLYGDNWSIKWNVRENRLKHWGYEGGDVVGLDSSPLTMPDGTKGKISYRANIDPGPLLFSAEDFILAAWLAYCSKAYFKLPESQRSDLDVPWYLGLETLEASYTVSNVEIDPNYLFPTQILWKWDSAKRAAIRKLRPHDHSIRILPTEEKLEGWIAGKYELLEVRREEGITIPERFQITRYRNQTRNRNSTNQSNFITKMEGELLRATWRDLKVDDTFLPDVPDVVRVKDFRFSDHIHFKLEHRYTLRKTSNWPDVNDPFVQAGLGRRQASYYRMYVQGPTVFGVKPIKVVIFLLFVGITSWIYFWWIKMERSN